MRWIAGDGIIDDNRKQCGIIDEGPCLRSPFDEFHPVTGKKR
jgi:hypothetical protein